MGNVLGDVFSTHIDKEIETIDLLSKMRKTIGNDLVDLFLTKGQFVKTTHIGDSLLTIHANTFASPIVFGQDSVGRWFFTCRYQSRESDLDVKSVDVKTANENHSITICQRGEGHVVDGLGVWVSFGKHSAQNICRFSESHRAFINMLLHDTNPFFEIT
jgi:hypothetical protein